MPEREAQRSANVMFYRDFHRFTGGHLKVWHYFNHVLSSPWHEAWVRFSDRTLADATNPWLSCPERVLPQRSTLEPDVLFLAGVDWLNLRKPERRRGSRPVINLIQGLAHAQPDDVRSTFLAHRAIRICVSTGVADALVATGQVNGPLITIPNGIDLDALRTMVLPGVKDVDVVVVANKNPKLGRRLYGQLQRHAEGIHLMVSDIPRPEFLALLARARICVFVPQPTEGFYLPALEAMALGTLVVCPDCTGNRSFCLPGRNCFRPDFIENHILEDVLAALQLPSTEADAMLTKASNTAGAHDLQEERRRFLDVLNNVEPLWASA